jgi:protein-L-isoaspartate(D-aspartate) O-methyltransferase
LRRYYGRMIGLAVGQPDGAVAAAFAAVPRERFLGPGPWQVFVMSGYVQTPSAEPAFIYQDVLVGLIPGKRINNGKPSLHARNLIALDPKPGEHAVHIGAGTGYYTAILARLLGHGLVDAYEIEPELAERARMNLADLSNVRVHARSATEGALPECDIVYVSAGPTHPPGGWLDCLRPGGRLLFPLTADNGFGGMLLVTRAGGAGLAARFVSPAGFIGCVGARDPDMSAALETAFRRGDWARVRSLRRGTPPDGSCWCAGQGWWLSTDPVDAPARDGRSADPQ